MSEPTPLRIVLFASAGCAPGLVRELRTIGTLSRINSSAELLSSIADGVPLIVADEEHWVMLTTRDRQLIRKNRDAGLRGSRVLLVTAPRSRALKNDFADVDLWLSASMPPAALASALHEFLKSTRLLEQQKPAERASFPSVLIAKKILIVDDSDLTNRITTAILREAGCIVFCITNPFEMRRYVREQTPDLVLVDYNMPALRGDHLIEINQRTGLKVPMLLYSSAAEEVLEAAARQSGAVGYLRKGESEAVLLSRIATCISQAPKPAPSVKESPQTVSSPRLTTGRDS